MKGIFIGEARDQGYRSAPVVSNTTARTQNTIATAMQTYAPGEWTYQSLFGTVNERPHSRVLVAGFYKCTLFKSIRIMHACKYNLISSQDDI